MLTSRVKIYMEKRIYKHWQTNVARDSHGPLVPHIEMVSIQKKWDWKAFKFVALELKQRHRIGLVGSLLLQSIRCHCPLIQEKDKLSQH